MALHCLQVDKWIWTSFFNLKDQDSFFHHQDLFKTSMQSIVSFHWSSEIFTFSCLWWRVWSSYSELSVIYSFFALISVHFLSSFLVSLWSSLRRAPFCRLNLGLHSLLWSHYSSPLILVHLIDSSPASQLVFAEFCFGHLDILSLPSVTHNLP